ncbi:MAG TPA: tRNA (adenosine(37)-N6)-threonylcarbamoyltransferase complex ATPase subunit type 1 TsaE [Firmicutes bacterium]|nr:tRNA (adenosine(37)-N6)-threonylcarbamoyltransferase complex ATPase subunit type 1 TsaE [Bacillota bacterium]
MLTLESTSADDTRRIGAILAGVLPRPVVVLLRGDYGAGKTTLVQGLAAGLGVVGAVRSPSYNIVRLYRGASGSLVHVDLYRAHGPAEVDELGIWEFVTDDSVVAIEWPGELAPSDRDYALLVVELELPSAGEAGAQTADSRRMLKLTGGKSELRRYRGVLSGFTA